MCFSPVAVQAPHRATLHEDYEAYAGTIYCPEALKGMDVGQKPFSWSMHEEMRVN